MSEMVKALGLALGANASEKWGGKPPLATCPPCGEPLVSTMDWRGYEFVCVCCGQHVGFVEPTPVVSTPELEARQKELQDQFDVARESGEDLDHWLRQRVKADRS